MRPHYEVADVIRKLGDDIKSLKLNSYQQATLRAISNCRTVALGGHIDSCSSCGVLSISYNSCRNRHCPKCQGHQRVKWLAAREAELLPVPYYHVVFTLPSSLNTLAMHRPKLVYDTLFASAWHTLRIMGRQQFVDVGMVSVLHTWGQALSLHPHLHCIVPAGGLDADKNWKALKGNGKYLFCVKAMSKIFRAKYVSLLRKAGVTDKHLLNSLFHKKWVVYAKRPFGKAKHVLEYLGRYTHKVAISNNRIISIDDNTVSFNYKDYKQHGKQKVMSLTHAEFIRRFALHIVPLRMVRIRHYGMLSATSKRKYLSRLQAQLFVTVNAVAVKLLVRCCRHCNAATLSTISVFDKRGPPPEFLTANKSAPAIK